MAQEVKNDIKKALQVNTIPLIAIMTAVTTVLTMLVKIPTPIRGYLNLSDTRSISARMRSDHGWAALSAVLARR